MGSMKTTEELLDQLKDFHSALGASLRRREKAEDRDLIRALLDHLRGHESRMYAELDRLEQLASRRILNEWHQYTPEWDAERLIEELRISEHPEVDDLVRRILYLDQVLLEGYRQLAESSASENVRDLFRNLEETGRNERNLFIRNMGATRDITGI